VEIDGIACFSINHIGVLPVYHMILIANMICDCRFVADTGCPDLFCSSEDSCDAIHFFTMFFYSCSQWPSCLSNVDTFTVFKVIDREADKAGRLIREAIWIRKTDNMDRDEGSYQLSWDKLLLTDDRHRKSVLMKASDVKSKRR